MQRILNMKSSIIVHEFCVNVLETLIDLVEIPAEELIIILAVAEKGGELCTTKISPFIHHLRAC